MFQKRAFTSKVRDEGRVTVAHLSIRLTDRTLRRLDALAEARRTSRSRLVRQMVEAAVDGAGVPDLPLPDEDELLNLLGEKARAGSVSAIRVLLDRERERDPREAALQALEAMAEGRRQ